jgi:hypothetical protein
LETARGLNADEVRRNTVSVRDLLDEEVERDEGVDFHTARRGLQLVLATGWGADDGRCL